MREGYKAAGVDIAEADAGLRNIVARITATWPKAGFGAVQLPIGYFANVIDIGGIGLAICTDGVGSKAIDRRDDGQIRHDRHRLRRDERQRPALRRRAAGVDGRLHRGRTGRRGDARRHRDRPRRGRAAGRHLDLRRRDRAAARRGARLRPGRHGGRHGGARPHHRRPRHRPGDAVIGIASSGIHSNGYDARPPALFFEQAGLSVDTCFAELGCTLGEELLRPTFIYVPEILEVLDQIRRSRH